VKYLTQCAAYGQYARLLPSPRSARNVPYSDLAVANKLIL
jgi:hypothetical protein